MSSIHVPTNVYDECTFLSLSGYLSLYVCVCLCLCVSLCICIYTAVSDRLSPFLCLSTRFFVSVSPSSTVSGVILMLSLLSVCLVCLSVCFPLSLRLYLYLSCSSCLSISRFVWCHSLWDVKTPWFSL